MADIEVTIYDAGPTFEVSLGDGSPTIDVTVEGSGPPGPPGPPGEGLPDASEEDEGKVLSIVGGVPAWSKIETGGGGGGVDFDVGNGLKLEGKVLSVDMAEGIEGDNTKPVSSALVFATVGNIGALLETI